MKIMKKMIGIFGVPRSGTSWLGQIFNSSPETKFSYQPMFTEKFRDQIHVRSSAQEMQDFFQKVYEADEDFLNQNDGKAKGHKLVFTKNEALPDIFVFKEVMYLYMIPHFLRNLPEMKVIYLLRNPKDVILSWYNAPNEFYPEWDIEKEWQFAPSKNWYLPERYYGFHRWKEAVSLAKLLQEEFENQIYIVKYEELDENPLEVVRKLFAFSGIKMQDQTERFICETRKKTENNPYSVYRNPSDRKESFRQLPESVRSALNRELQYFTEAKIWYKEEI